MILSSVSSGDPIAKRVLKKRLTALLSGTIRLHICSLWVARKKVERYQRINLCRANIQVTGFRRDIHDLFFIFDCILAPSYAEPFGLVVIEAMRAGCRVIVRDTFGLRDIAAVNPDVMAIADSDSSLIRDALDRTYALREIPPKYDMSLYDKWARVAEVEAFYRELMRSTRATASHDRALPSVT